MGEKSEAQQPELATNDGYPKLSERQARALEQAVYNVTMKPQLTFTPRAEPETPSRRWWIEDAETLPRDDSSYLCETCRHIDINYLVHSPTVQALEEVTLCPLKDIVANDKCVFCRLLTAAMKDAAGNRKLFTQVGGKDMICKLRTIPTGFDHRCTLLVSLYPAPDKSDGFNHLIFQTCQPREKRFDENTTQNRHCIQSPQIDFDQARAWYQNCLDGQCGSNPIPPPAKSICTGFRLMDVERHCIVPYERQCNYVALSYVWGGIETIRNLKKTRQSLEVDGALLRKEYPLPRTIKDAMLIVRELGERYLWVDSLCIVQDDELDKGTQIAAMNQIYTSAILTIAAVSGIKADSGLAGVGEEIRAFRQHIEKVQSVYLTNSPTTFTTTVDESVWNSRAWTLQERIMSPRVLFVAKDRCFYACKHRQKVLMESVDNTEDGLARELVVSGYEESTANMIPSAKDVNTVCYSTIVESYTSRHLTYESDILIAFQGIETLLRPLFRSDFIFGLPRSELDSQLLWQHAGPCARRRDPFTGIAMFPSWSWAGWVGEIFCKKWENLSRIKWIEGEKGKTFSGKDFRYPKGASTDLFKSIAFRQKWKGALKHRVPYYMEKSEPDKYFLHPTAPEEERILGPNLKSGTNYLVFEAETTDAFEIGLDHFLPHSLFEQKCTHDKHVVCPLLLHDSGNFIGGYVMVPGEITMRLSNDDAHAYDFIRISRTRTWEQDDRGEEDPDLLNDSEAITLEKSYFPDRPDMKTSSNAYACDPRRFDLTKPWCLYNIMFVEWKEGVAYRIGVGQMHIDAWAQANPKTKNVVLG
ncbi:MAG: hypothetical protein LQ350_005432 [Teloschistes chrysophthalmus]|nr:MAG: hypothetical protein LQ350_005432 [Niorma chrysophthalma]